MLKKVDDVLFHAVKGISELITKPGYISLDFADVRTAMGDAGLAMMGTGIAKGEARAREAALQAISSPLLEDVSIDGARHVLMNVTADKNIQLDEVTEAANIVTEGTHHDQAYVFFGMVIDEAMGDEMRITVIATGIDRTQEKILEVGQAASAQIFRNGRPVLPPKPAVARNELDMYEGVDPRLRQRVLDRLNRESSPEDSSPVRTAATWHRSVPPQGQRQTAHTPGEDGFIFDDDADMADIPAFLIKQAN
jgi:cell division protein FtsZ